MKKGDGKGGTFVKHLFKKNQIIITTLAVMIAELFGEIIRR